ncbi:hypothetical protein FB107DRAFT_252199 [Schizophyllum commune]
MDTPHPPIRADPADPSQEQPIPVDPAADFFGDYDTDYAAGDFPGLEDGDGSPQEHGNSAAGNDTWDDEGDEDEEDSDEDDAYDVDLERAFEPERPTGADDGDIDMDHEGGEHPDQQAEAARDLRDHAEEHLRCRPFVVKYPGRAGEAIAAHEQSSNTQYRQAMRGGPSDIYGVFGHRLAWDLARWAKTQDISAKAFNELLALPQLVDKLDLPYHTTAHVNSMVMRSLDAHDSNAETWSWQDRGLTCTSETFSIRALVSDIDLCPLLVFCPERHYTDDKKATRLYHDMNTGEWWWSTQDELEARRPGATIIPIILSSDKTQLTSFRNKTAYPVYMTIGNIPKEVRRRPSTRSYVLLGCLPTSRLLHFKNEAARRRCLANLFHMCLRRIVRPLRTAGLDGVDMATADGVVLCTCAKSGTCAQCGQSNTALGDFDRTGRWYPQYRKLAPVLDVLNTYDQDPVGYARRCKAIGLRPIVGVKPFWQGVVKHLVSWLVDIFGAAEIDAHCRRMPPNHNTRIFMDGISSLSFVTGQTHDEICRVLLGLVLDIPLPNRSHSRVVRAHPIHTDETLRQMNDALESFHREKDVFIELKVRDNFNIPKLHFATHYVQNIRMFGTTDNFNTHARRRSTVTSSTSSGALRDVLHFGPYDWTPPGLELDRTARLSKRASATVTFDSLVRDYGADVFIPALKRYIALANNPSLTTRVHLEDAVHTVMLRFSKVKVWHRIKFVVRERLTGKRVTKDSIHARPARLNKRGLTVPGRFDTALMSDGSSRETGVHGNRVGRIRVVFSIPETACPSLFPIGFQCPKHLAYVEWYTPFPSRPERDHLMYKISKCRTDGGQRMLASIVPLEHIRRSVHLIPKFGRAAPADWTSSNVLDHCDVFYVNPFTD